MPPPSRPAVDPSVGLGRPGDAAWQKDVGVLGTGEPVGGDEAEIGVYPLDGANAALLDLVAPRTWRNPRPAPPAHATDELYYDLVAIGAGAGGLVSAKQAARRGARSALVEKHLAGGDCLNVGCVPSKALIRCARTLAELQRAGEFGVQTLSNTHELDFSAVMARLRRLRAQIAPADSFDGVTAVGAACFQGAAHFTSPQTLEVAVAEGGVRHIRFGKAVVATGGSGFVPPIPGLREAPYHTNASLYNMTALPTRMVVIGAGPIGLEMAQAFALFGTEVTVILRDDTLLPKEDPDAAAIVRTALVESGVRLVTQARYDAVAVAENENRWTPQNPCCTADFPALEVQITKKDTGDAQTLECDAILVAAGRRPNVEGLGLEAAGVAYDAKTGVQVNDRLQTTNKNVFAVGDVCSKFQFTHVSGTHAQMVVQNALFGGAEKVSDMVIPWATYTEPEVAHVGVYGHELEAAGEACDTYTASFEHNDRAILEGATNGFVRVHCKPGSEEIIGATIVAPCAGEMISELTVAIQHRIPLGKAGLGSVIHSYPTLAEGVGGVAFQCKMKAWEKLEVNEKTTRTRVTKPKDRLAVPTSKRWSFGAGMATGLLLGAALGAAGAFVAVKR